MLNLRNFRTQKRGFSDLLPYAVLCAPGVVLCKDGTLIAGFTARGQDTASSTEDELAYVSMQFNSAVRLLGSGWMIQVDAVRTNYHAYPPREASHFPDHVSQLIDDERRKFFSDDVCFRTKTVILLSYKIPFGSDRVSSLAQTGMQQSNALERAINAFQNTISELDDALSSILKLRRLNDYSIVDDDGTEHLYSSLLSHIQHCITGMEQPVRVPKIPMYLDALLGSDDFIAGLAPRVGEQHIAVLGIDGFPQESWPAMLAALDGLKLQYRYSTRFICMDQLEATKEINSFRKGWQQKVFRFIDKFFNNPNARANRDAALMVEDAEQALVDVQGGRVGAGFLTSCIVLQHDNRELLRDWARELRRLILSLGFGCRFERINAVEAWLGTHPGNWFANLRRPILNTLNLADLLPLSSVWTGEQFCPCPFYPEHSPPLMVCTTDGSTPFWFNLHVRDLGHTAILGPTGSGKSTLLALIAVQTRRYANAQIFAFDKGMSMYAACKGCGGAHYEIGTGKALSFAPLAHIDDPADMSWAEEWIATLLELQGTTVTPGNRAAIHNAMVQLRADSKEFRSLSHFKDAVQDHRIKEGLTHYTIEGAMGSLLDASEDSFGISRFMVFEIEELMAFGPKNIIPVLLYLFRYIERSLHGQPGFIIFDEAWVMFADPVAKAKIKEQLKVMRKKNCAVILATQSITDVASSGIMDVIVESCPTKIYLADLTARQETRADMYKKFGLNDRQIEIIASATPKRDYYMDTPNGRRLIQLALQKETLAFVGVSDPDSISRIKELEVSHGETWQMEWLRERAS
ncbi:MAG: conjugal transfer protein TrbE [Desulfovibrionaceae bacterium]|nr:conjugal transfer protein TrbE [Desulfovibrionaceae bacterium]